MYVHTNIRGLVLIDWSGPFFCPYSAGSLSFCSVGCFVLSRQNRALTFYRLRRSRLSRSWLRTRFTTPSLKNLSSPAAVRPPMYHLSAPSTSRKPSLLLSLPRLCAGLPPAPGMGRGVWSGWSWFMTLPVAPVRGGGGDDAAVEAALWG